MRVITRIEMANNEDIYNVGTGETLAIVDSKDGYFEVFENNECILDNAISFQEALNCAKEYVVNDGMIIVTGYGKHSGRKFWQLPKSLQKQVLKCAGF